jgi:mannose-6-phosphate isomerase-like protein (cupin superfamily)
MRRTSIGLLALTLSIAISYAQTGRQGGGAGRGQAAPSIPGLPLQATNERSIPISKEQMGQYLKEMDDRKLSMLRVLEGSGAKYNLNIRRISEPEPATSHANTADFWVVIEGSGTITTGGKVESGKIVGGVSRPIKAGDVELIPPTVAHAVTQVNGGVTYLNIRWDTDWASK